MNTTPSTTRVNVTLPTDLVSKLKERVPERGISGFLAEVAQERIEREERKEALQELLKVPPTFEDIEDSVEYIRKERQLDEERAKRLGI